MTLIAYKKSVYHIIQLHGVHWGINPLPPLERPPPFFRLAPLKSANCSRPHTFLDISFLYIGFSVNPYNIKLCHR